MLRDNVVRYSVGLFVFTLVLAVGALNRLEEPVHQFVALVVAVFGVASIADFLFLIDYAARLLRPVSIVARIGDEGIKVIRAVYPHPTERADSSELRKRARRARSPRRSSGRSEIVLAIDLPTLITLARQHDGVIEFVPQVGDFVATDEPLFVLYGGAAAIADEALRATVAFGTERTLEQDPMFAFRILVDIGLKALSPAINDPTTAVLAIDQVHRLLRVLGRRHLRPEVMLDDSGQPRVIFRTPNWEDFVHVACTEIRACGANNIQVARRLRAMLDNLVQSLPSHRHAALQRGARPARPDDRDGSTTFPKILRSRALRMPRVSAGRLLRICRARVEEAAQPSGRVDRRNAQDRGSRPRDASMRIRAMPIEGPVPGWILSLIAAATLFAIMFDLGSRSSRASSAGSCSAPRSC